MSPEQFESVLKVAVPFLKHSHADVGMKVNRNDDREPHRKKVLGIFGGEPLMHPEFPTLVDIMCKYVPQPHRGLWTCYDWVNGESKLWGAYKPQVERLLGKNPTGSVLDMSTGYLNWNMHEEDQPCSHSPVLVAADDVVKDKKERWDKISKCWIQTEWSAAYALDYNEEVKFYFCEVASAFDRVFNLGTGLPVEDGVWSHHLWFAPDKEGILQPHGPYAKQILSTCGRCGGSLRLEGRRDRENVDDVSPSNLIPLTVAGSPMIRKGQYNKVESAKDSKQDSEPWEYQKDGRAKQIENFKGAVGHADWLNTYVPKSRPKGDNEWNS
jgi:hypothetical protein